MATSGQILDILGRLEKGSAKVERQEKGARKKERRKHRSMFTGLTAEMGRASRKAKKYSGIGDVLSTVAMLTGVGVPLAAAIQFGGSWAGGAKGAKEAEKYMKGIKGFKGTKFGTEKETYEEEIGADVMGDALRKATTLAITAGTGKISSAKLRDWGLKEFLGKTPIAGKSLEKIVGAKTPIQSLIEKGLKPFGKGNILQKVKLARAIKTPLGKALLGESDDLVLDRLISSVYKYDKERKRTSIFDYDLPASLKRPTSEFGGYY